jgi:hypothetical protein
MAVSMKPGEDTGDVDDASPALLEHGTGDLLGTEICRSEIGLQDGVPIGALHAHDELVAGDAGIVHQDVNLVELGDRGFNGGLDLLFIGDVESERCRLSAGRGNFVYQLIQLVLIARGDGDCRARRGESQRAGPSDALRRACDQRHPSGKGHEFFSSVAAKPDLKIFPRNVELYPPPLAFGATLQGERRKLYGREHQYHSSNDCRLLVRRLTFETFPCLKL